MITYDDFKKIEIRAGKILSAEKIADTDKLLKLSVDLGEFEEVGSGAPASEVSGKSDDRSKQDIGETKAVSDVSRETNFAKIPKPRQIVSGIALYFPDPSVLVGKTCMFVANLEPRTIKGVESNGMIFAISDENGHFSLLEPSAPIKPGSLAK